MVGLVRRLKRYREECIDVQYVWEKKRVFHNENHSQYDRISIPDGIVSKILD
jgi:hypothetical protein